MNSKTKAITLITVVLVAAVTVSIAFALQSTAKATTAVASDSETTSTPSAVTQDNNGFNPQQVPAGEFGFSPRGPCGRFGRGYGGFGGGAMQVSSDYVANVTAIAKADSDVQNLLNQGYNITSVHPQITTSIDANGNILTKATTAIVDLKGTNGRATVIVDLSQEKVTKIVTLTITEIDK
ncbi:MAG: hypothetical protein NWE98_07750 [Candidatus Bathyarchaeota archaeon]|nr:hypothetical protein [Candidatus Bathyarchaeota archaeon]